MSWGLTIAHVENPLHLSTKVSVTWCIDDVDFDALHADEIYEMVLQQPPEATTLIKVKGQARCVMNGQCTL